MILRHLTWTWPYSLSSEEPNPVGVYKFLTYISEINIARWSPVRIGKFELHSSYFVKPTKLINGKCYLNKLHLENKLHMQASHKLGLKRKLVVRLGSNLIAENCQQQQINLMKIFTYKIKTHRKLFFVWKHYFIKSGKWDKEILDKII